MTPIKPDGRSKKQYTPTCGIYAIVHIPSARRYVGSSIEIEKRLFLHVFHLRAGTHHTSYLQNIWSKHGESEFQYFLLEICPRDSDVLVEREQFHIDATPFNLLLNSQPAGKSPLGRKYTLETKKLISEAAKRRAADPVERKLRSDRAKAQHAAKNLGASTWTDNGRERVRAASRNGLGIKLAQEAAKRNQTSEEMSRRSKCRDFEAMRTRHLPIQERIERLRAKANQLLLKAEAIEKRNK